MNFLKYILLCAFFIPQFAAASSKSSTNTKKPTVFFATRESNKSTFASELSEKCSCCNDQCWQCTPVTATACCLLTMLGVNHGLTYVYNQGVNVGNIQGYQKAIESNQQREFDNGYYYGVHDLATMHKISKPTLDEIEHNVDAAWQDYLKSRGCPKKKKK